MKFVVYLVLVVVVVDVFIQNVSAKPYNRIKRVSDQRLAELETLVALSKMSGKLVTVPLGYGKIDPKYIGRRRRSQQSIILDRLFNGSSEEDNGDPEPPELQNYADILYKR